MIWSRPEYQRLAEKLQAYAGFVFAENRHKSSEIHMITAMRESGFDDLTNFEMSVQKDKKIFLRFVDCMVIGETYFQREHVRLDFLRSTILPKLREQRSSQHCFKIWSAGCSTGEEAYTLAAVLIEAGLKDRFHITATDISTRSLQKAETGLYSKWSFRGVEDKFVSRYFNAIATGDWVVKDEMRQNITFRRLNLMESNIAQSNTDLAQSDLIFCRNVLIYFDPESVARISQEFCQCLSAGGWLVTGASDPLLSRHADFETLVLSEGTFYVKPRPDVLKKEAVSMQTTIQKSFNSSIANVPRRTSSKASIAIIEAAVDKNDLAEQHFKDGKWQAVLDLFQDDDPNEMSMSFVVRSCSNLGQLDKAEAQLAKGLKMFPLSVEFWFLQSLLCIERRNYAESLQILKKVIYLDRSIASAFLTMAFVQEVIGDTDSAIRSYRNALKLCSQISPSEEIYLGNGQTGESMVALATNRIDRLSLGGLTTHGQ